MTNMSHNNNNNQNTNVTNTTTHTISTSLQYQQSNDVPSITSPTQQQIIALLQQLFTHRPSTHKNTTRHTTTNPFNDWKQQYITSLQSTLFQQPTSSSSSRHHRRNHRRQYFFYVYNHIQVMLYDDEELSALIENVCELQTLLLSFDQK